MQTPISSLSLHPRTERNDDSVAQPVEHNTFNVGVLGSNPSWITKTSEKTKQTPEIQRISGVSIFRQNLKNSGFRGSIGKYTLFGTRKIRPKILK